MAGIYGGDSTEGQCRQRRWERHTGTWYGVQEEEKMHIQVKVCVQKEGICIYGIYMVWEKGIRWRDRWKKKKMCIYIYIWEGRRGEGRYSREEKRRKNNKNQQGTEEVKGRWRGETGMHRQGEGTYMVEELQSKRKSTEKAGEPKTIPHSSPSLLLPSSNPCQILLTFTCSSPVLPVPPPLVSLGIECCPVSPEKESRSIGRRVRKQC